MKPEGVKAIFTNLLFVIGVILLIIGFSRGILTATRLLTFEKYPLDYYAETRCNIAPMAPGTSGEVMPKVDTNCNEALEHERRIKLTDDIVNSVTMLVAGFVLALSFRRFIFEKKVS